MADKLYKSWVGGMNDYLDLEFLEDTQYSRGVNLVNRGGHAASSPRVSDVCDLPTGKFQRVFNYRNDLYAVVDGQVYPVVDGTLGAAVSGVSMSPLVDMVYGTETHDFLMLSDGVGNVAAVGDVLNRMSSTGELTNIGLIAFGQNRVFFTDKSRRILYAADIYEPGVPESVLKATEMNYLNESFEIMQPAAFGRINSMAFIRSNQSGTGLGQLVVFSEGGACAYNVSGPRATNAETNTAGWLDSQIGVTLFKHGGCSGPFGTLQVNNDLLYREAVGITTLKTFNTSSDQTLKVLPISVPITNLLSRDPAWALWFMSGAVSDNRIIYTHGARHDRIRDGSSCTTGDVYFDSLVSIDLASYYSNGETAMTPDGFWTGNKFLQVLPGYLRGRRVVYVVYKGPNNANKLAVLSTGAVSATQRSRLYTKRISFASEFIYSRFQMAELWFENIKTNLTGRLLYRGESGLWRVAGTFSYTVPYYDAETYDALPKALNKLRVTIATRECDAMTRILKNRAATFQMCVEFTGTAELSRLRLNATDDSTDTGEILSCEDANEEILTTSDADVILYDYDHLDEVPA